MPRSTVQRIVGALHEERLVIASGTGGSIRLGPEISALAGGADSGGTDRPAPAGRYGTLNQPIVAGCFGPP